MPTGLPPDDPGLDPVGPAIGAPSKGVAAREGLAYELKYLNKHLPGTKESNKLIQSEGAAHVFTDLPTLSAVEATILQRGQPGGIVRGTERFGFRFDQPIGARIARDGSRVPLAYGEMKLQRDGRYHIIPRTGPSR